MSRDSYTFWPSYSQLTIMRICPFSHSVTRGSRQSAGDMPFESTQLLPLSIEQTIIEKNTSSPSFIVVRGNTSVLSHIRKPEPPPRKKLALSLDCSVSCSNSGLGLLQLITPLCLPSVDRVASATTS
ncbi:exo-alpha-sialidase [Trypanosoma cruzi]|nr:exo-alpha-sialidase [Trypanosoma cruzi]